MNGASHLLATDSGWAGDKTLVAELSRLNTQISRYIFNLLDVDAGRAEPIGTGAERDFGGKLVELGERVQSRAGHRAALGELPLQVVGEAAQSPALEPTQPPG